MTRSDLRITVMQTEDVIPGHYQLQYWIVTVAESPECQERKPLVFCLASYDCSSALFVALSAGQKEGQKPLDEGLFGGFEDQTGVDSDRIQNNRGFSSVAV
ncbi:hypothetical protein PG984_014569 [Apiospora sp. TS-2023a]